MCPPKGLVLRVAGLGHSTAFSTCGVFRSWWAFSRRWWSEHIFFTCTLWLGHELFCSVTRSLTVMLWFSTDPKPMRLECLKPWARATLFSLWANYHRVCPSTGTGQHGLVFLCQSWCGFSGGVGGCWGWQEPHPNQSCVSVAPHHDTMQTMTLVSSSHGRCWPNTCPLSLFSFPTKSLTLRAFENCPTLLLWCLSTTKPAWTPPRLVYPRKTLSLRHPPC